MISISIVSHGQNFLVNNMLSNLVEVEPDLAFELILTENIRDDVELKNDVRGFSLKILRNRSPQGLARNQNAAFRVAQGNFFCVLNPDILLVEPVFGPLMRLVEAGKADVAAPMVVDTTGMPQDSFRNVPSPLELVQRRVLRQKIQPTVFMPGEIIHPEWIAGMFLLMRYDTYRKLGGFDEGYHLYFEDVDFCCRARLAGLTLAVDTGLKVIHQARRESRHNLRYLAWHVASACRFFMSPVYRQARRLP